MPAYINPNIKADFIGEIPEIPDGFNIPVIYHGKVVGRANVFHDIEKGVARVVGTFDESIDGQIAKEELFKSIIDHMYFSISLYPPSDKEGGQVS